MDGKDAGEVIHDTLKHAMGSQTPQAQDPISIAMRNTKHKEVIDYLLENNMIVDQSERGNFPQEKIDELTKILERNGVSVPK